LNFPNTTTLAPLPWVPRELSAHLTLNWKLRESFTWVGSLIDEMADAPGVWEDIKRGIKEDPNGPQVDLEKELVAYCGERATLLSDYRLPITTKSERLAVAIEVNNAVAVAKAINKIMESDPNANRHQVGKHTIWEIVNGDSTVEVDEINIEGAGFTSTAVTAKDPAEEKEKPMIPNSAVTVAYGHLIIATHLDFVRDLLKDPVPEQALSDAADFQLVAAALDKLGAKDDSFRFFTRSDEAYRPTYELLQQGKMPEAETVMGKVLNKLLGPEEEGVLRKQEIRGEKMPDFQAVRRYLGPAGLYVRSEPDGWSIIGCLLTKEAEQPEAETK
jgi:hypothetical protein